MRRQPQPSQNLPLANPEAAKGCLATLERLDKDSFFSFLYYCGFGFCVSLVLIGDGRRKDAYLFTSVSWTGEAEGKRERKSPSLLFTSQTGCFFLSRVFGPFPVRS